MGRPSRTRAGTASVSQCLEIAVNPDVFTSARHWSFPALLELPPDLWCGCTRELGQLSASKLLLGAGQGWGRCRACPAGFERQQGQGQLLLAAQIPGFVSPSIPLFPFLPFHPHKFFSQPFPNMQHAKVSSFHTDSILHTLYLFLITTIWWSYHCLLEHQRKTESPHPPFLTLQYSAFACYSLVRGTTGHGHLHIQEFPLLISVLKPFVISPSWCHRWAVATCRPLIILYACKISVSLWVMGEITNLCACYHVSPSSKSTFCSFKCSTVVLIFNSLLSHHVITISLIDILLMLPGFLTEELCWSWICYLIKTLIKILFPWVKKTHPHSGMWGYFYFVQELEWKETILKITAVFFNLPMKYRNRMTFSYCFTLSCYDESMQLLAVFDQRQRWNPKLCSYSCGLFFFF